MCAKDVAMPASQACNHRTPVSVFQWTTDSGWERKELSTRDLRIAGPNGIHEMLSEDSQVCLILASATEIRGCSWCKQAFIDAFCMPALWWEDSSKRCNGYFGCETTQSPPGFNSWARFQVKIIDGVGYEWENVNVFTRYLQSTGQTRILAFNMPVRSQWHMLDKTFKPDPVTLGDPFWVYQGIIEEVVHLQDIAVWTSRDELRALEKSRSRVGNTWGQPAALPQVDYQRFLDSNSRHNIHITETLEVAVQNVENILVQHANLMTHLAVDQAVLQNVHSRLQFLQGLIGGLRWRSISNKERMTNEIQLAFQTIAQLDSSVTIEIGRAARADSAAMKTVAFATLAFLPPTFICAIFSMTFFRYSDSGEWDVSDKFWLYWAFAVPTTIATIGLWLIWQRKYENRMESGVTNALKIW